MDEIKFTVVIPLYNKENSILSTLKSVLEQTYKNFELIVVNDGSTDKSLKVIEHLRDDRIRIVDKENGGVSSARNEGIKLAKFPWIALLDGDDLWLPNFLEMICSMIMEYPNAAIIAVGWNYEDGSYKFPINSKGYIDNYFAVSLKGSVLSSSSIVIRNSCFEEVGFFNEGLSYGEDLEMWCRLSGKFKIAFLPISLSIYRVMTENRACTVRKMDISRHFAYNLSLKNSYSKDEKKYYRKIIRDCMMQCIKFEGKQNIYALMRKHGKREILFDFVLLNINRILNLLSLPQIR